MKWDALKTKEVFDRQFAIAKALNQTFSEFTAKMDKALTNDMGFADPEIDPAVVLCTHVQVVAEQCDFIKDKLMAEIGLYNEDMQKSLEDSIMGTMRTFNDATKDEPEGGE